MSGGDEGVEVAQGAGLGIDGFVAAFFGADGPGAAWVFWRGGHAVVATFAKGVADGVNWWEVEHVEAHGGDGWHECFDVGEGAVTSWVWGGGSGEKLVPGGVAGSFAVDPEMQLLLVPRGVG